MRLEKRLRRQKLIRNMERFSESDSDTCHPIKRGANEDAKREPAGEITPK